MSNDRQVPSDIEFRIEIEGRNQIRRQAGLPPVVHSHEYARMRQFQNEQEFEQLMQSQLRYRVEAKLLSRTRRRINNPAWVPTGMLSGGGWAFHVALTKQMRKLAKRLVTRTSPALVFGSPII